MRKLIGLLVLAAMIGACGGGENEKLMRVEGNVKGLKKGTLYFQHIPDSILVTIDSLEIAGDGRFYFETPVESPKIYYIYLKKKDNNEFNDRISFFGEPGTVKIETSWNTFDTQAVIEGSETQKKLEEYESIMNKFHAQNLDIMQASALPEFQGDSAALDSLQRASDRIIVRGYRYALNFALSNSNSYIAPYIALNEAANANPVYLDSIFRSLSPEVADSHYGRALKAHLEATKTGE